MLRQYHGEDLYFGIGRRHPIGSNYTPKVCHIETPLFLPSTMLLACIEGETAHPMGESVALAGVDGNVSSQRSMQILTCSYIALH